MCGIAGKVYFAADRKVDPQMLRMMTDVMSHRGPDDVGIYQRGNVGLGHRRLSIIDLSPAGHQPMCNEDRTVWVIFNGEIYNYKVLRRQLENEGHKFHSQTDTEVIVHAYEEYGTECAKYFDGMFAFALWDERCRRLVISRDHFGIKPLYYYHSSEFVSFASEIKAIFEDEEVSRELDEQALSNFLSLHYVPAPRTMFADVQKLRPGHTLVVEEGRVNIHKFWELRKQVLPHMSEEDMADLVYKELKDSVAERLQSDVPIGTLLSGGLDSSAILGLMTELSGPGVSAFSVGYSGDGNDGFSEFQYSRLAARHFQSDYHEVIVTPSMFLDFLPKAVWYQDEPIGEPASIPLYYICKLAKDQGVTVLLSGEGSDELFAGYNRHIGEMLSAYYGILPRALLNSAEWLFGKMPRVPVLRKGHRAMGMRDFWERYKSWHTVFPNDLKHQLLTFREGLTETFSDVFAVHTPEDLSLNLDKILWLDAQVWLPDDLLMKKDRMGMATSIEARVPFLDHRFAEMAFSLPAAAKVKRFAGKHIFKKSMERVLPEEIIYRRKAGFPTPISKWMAQDLRQPLGEIVCQSGASDHGRFDRKLVRQLWDEHASGRENHERLLFPVLNFDLWYQTFFGTTPKGRRCTQAPSTLA
jgi:asparagine synthase (glutamine-hydrolysing)